MGVASCVHSSGQCVRREHAKKPSNQVLLGYICCPGEVPGYCCIALLWHTLLHCCCARLFAECLANMVWCFAAHASEHASECCSCSVQEQVWLPLRPSLTSRLRHWHLLAACLRLDRTVVAAMSSDIAVATTALDFIFMAVVECCSCHMQEQGCSCGCGQV